MYNLSKKNISALTALLLALCFCFASVAMAAPASGSPVWVTDASGTRFQICAHGDEFFNYTTDTQGRLLVRDAEGYFRYVGESGGALVPLGRIAQNDTAGALLARDIDSLRDKLAALRASLIPAKSGLNTIPLPDVLSDGYFFSDPSDPLYNRVAIYDSSSFTAPGKADTCALLVLKVQFDDIKCLVSDAQWHKMLFDDGISSYYSENSYGKFTYVPAAESGGTPSDGVVTVTLPIQRPLYVNKEPGNPKGNHELESGFYESSDGTQRYTIYNSASLFAYALLKAEDDIDYAQYDRNKDGYISPTELAVIVVVAGYEASTLGDEYAGGTPSVWAHSWKFNNKINETQTNWNTLTVRAGGMKFYKYTMMGENTNWAVNYYDDTTWGNAVQQQFGTACHELGHDLGLPDLYDIYYNDLQYSVGHLSVMASGASAYGAYNAPKGSSPVHFDPFCKLALGFAREQTVTAPGSYELKSANRSDYNVICIDTDDPNVYYLAENRQFAGYDKGLYAGYELDDRGGVVLWRMDENMIEKGSDMNTVEGKYGVMPVFVLKGKDRYTYRPFRSSETLSIQSSYTLPETNPPITVSVNDAPSESMRIILSVDNDTPSGGGSGTATRTQYSLKPGEKKESAEMLPNGGLQYTIDAPFERHTGAAVDARPLQRGVDYEVKSGSTVITLKPEFLATLKDGAHTLTVYFSDGSFTQSFTTPLSSSISTAASPDVPATGGAPFALPLLFAAMLTAAGATHKKLVISK